MKSINFFILSVFMFYGCDFSVNEDNDNPQNEINSLSIPEDFDFSTSHDVTITINDNDGYAKYDVYAYTDELYDAGTETFEDESGETVTETVYKSEVLEKLIFTGVPVNGLLKQTFNIPKFYDKLYIRRNEHLNYSSSIVDIVDQKVNFSFSDPQSSLRTAAV